MGLAGFSVREMSTSPNNSSSTKKTAFLINSIKMQNSKLDIDDQILSINGLNITGMTLEEVLPMLKGKPGQEMYLIVQKCDEKLNNNLSTSLANSTNNVSAKFIAQLPFGDTSMDGVVEVSKILTFYILL